MSSSVVASLRKPARLAALLALCALIQAAPARSIDNPDAPDLVAQFEAREHPFEIAVREQASTTEEIALAYGRYEKFLGDELNLAYSALRKRLTPKNAEKLAQSQRRWLQYRDAENGFIADNWTAASFGTSSVVSRGAYRTTLARDRVVILLQYLKNYRE